MPFEGLRELARTCVRPENVGYWAMSGRKAVAGLGDGSCLAGRPRSREIYRVEVLNLRNDLQNRQLPNIDVRAPRLFRTAEQLRLRPESRFHRRVVQLCLGFRSASRSCPALNLSSLKARELSSKTRPSCKVIRIYEKDSCL